MRIGCHRWMAQERANELVGLGSEVVVRHSNGSSVVEQRTCSHRAPQAQMTAPKSGSRA